jgi:hypothetical protein
MRTLNVVFEDKEYEKLESNKGDMSWHDYCMFLASVTPIAKKKAK